VRLLEKFGCRVDVARNGREAVEAWSRNGYELILMDCQMPEMDGFEATSRIREQEEAAGRRTIIVALTASAMTGDREKCLKAGMDDYIAKPIKPEDLSTVLDRWLKPRGNDEGAPSAPVAEPDDGLLGSALRTLLGIDEEGGLLCEVIDTFLRIAPLRLATLRKAAEKSSASTLERTAHSLLGSCVNVGAKRMADLCARLEERGRAGSAVGAAESVRALEVELQRVRPLLLREKERYERPAAGRPTGAS
jgi:CheY-like chemotaxis protein